MNSSGIKRTMAAFAIAAVAVAGIPALAGTASADNINQMVEENGGLNQIRLFNSQNNFEVSTKPDGTDSTVRLEAGGGRNVDNVRFEYTINGGATWITAGDATRNDDGAFSYEWANPPVGHVMTLRARNITPAGSEQHEHEDPNIEVFGDDPNTETVNLTTDSDQGYYDTETPGCNIGINMIVSGTQSETSTSTAEAPRLGTVNADADNNFNNNDFEDLGNLNTNYADNMSPSGKFSGYIDLDNYDFANTAGEFPDQAVVRAQTDSTGINNETEDFEAYTLYSQVPTSVVVTDDGTGNGGLPTEVTVKVLDQKGEPIAQSTVVQSQGGQVRRHRLAR